MDLNLVQAYVAGYFRRSCWKRVTVLSIVETPTTGQYKVEYEWECFPPSYRRGAWEGDELGEIGTDVLYLTPKELLGDFT